MAGIDFGTVRIGVALSDPLRMIASPHANYQRVSESADADYFRSLVETEEMCLFVVGLPIHLSGDESQKSTAARSFGAWLKQVTSVPVDFFDERFTTREAEQRLVGAKLTNKSRKARRDMLAAQIMLAAWLERSSSDESSWPLED